MARQRLGEKKVKKLRMQTGLDILAVLVRGDTGHRQDLCLSDGSIVSRWPDGSLEKSRMGHSMKPSVQ